MSVGPNGTTRRVSPRACRAWDVGLQAVTRRVTHLLPGLVDAALGVHRKLSTLASKDQAT
jgi:hypothetical protein